jgi:hypothetical protein
VGSWAQGLLGLSPKNRLGDGSLTPFRHVPRRQPTYQPGIAHRGRRAVCATTPKDVPTSGAKSPPANPIWKRCAPRNDAYPRSSTSDAPRRERWVGRPFSRTAGISAPTCPSSAKNLWGSYIGFGYAACEYSSISARISRSPSPDPRAADRVGAPAGAAPPPDAVGPGVRRPWRRRLGRAGSASAGPDTRADNQRGSHSLDRRRSG